MSYQLRELGIGGILDQAIALLKNRFGLLLGITMVMLVPFQLLAGLVTLSSVPQLPPNPTMADVREYQREALSGGVLLKTVPLSMLLVLVILPLTNAAITYAVASEYLNRPITVGGAVRRVFHLAFPYLGTGILFFLAVWGGMLLLLIPGIVFAFWFALWGQVVVIEGTAGPAALKRSKFLMKGNIGKFFVLGMIVGFINAALGLIAGLITEPYVRQAVISVLQGVLASFGCAAYVVFYFSCRCKAENFDLTLLADSVAADSAPAVD